MNLVETLQKKIEVLGAGEYVPGLRAVLMHIETAFKHLSRGQRTDDQAAFTDAIYRTNQAFEGSIKEAYRVLAGQDPTKTRPFDIENYLEKNSVFRTRVLNQISSYRKEWRNPSTHDYKLDFDESEAFLAIVSVSALACLLLDQIGERLAFQASMAESDVLNQESDSSLSETASSNLAVTVADLLTQFCGIYSHFSVLSSRPTEPQVIGAIHGFLSSTASGLTIETDVKLNSDKPDRVDLVIARGDQKVIVEIKRNLAAPDYVIAVEQVKNYLSVSGLGEGVLLILPGVPGKMKRLDVTGNGIPGRIIMLAPGNH